MGDIRQRIVLASKTGSDFESAMPGLRAMNKYNPKRSQNSQLQSDAAGRLILQSIQSKDLLTARFQSLYICSRLPPNRFGLQV